MSKQAKIYWLAIVISGFAMFARVLYGWHPDVQELPRLGLYILAALATSGFKVRLPGVFSTLSMNYVFIIAGLIDLRRASASKHRDDPRQERRFLHAKREKHVPGQA